MSGFNGINSFGSLTNKSTGQKITWDDIKKYDLEENGGNANGKIEGGELAKAIKELQLDSVSFTTVDTNKSKDLSEDEFNAWDQKVQIQEAINEKLQKAYDDPVLSKYLTQMKKDFTTHMNTFISEYKGDVSGMSNAYKQVLETKYNEYTQNILANDSTSVLNSVLDDIYGTISKETDSSGKTYTATEAQVVIEAMETIANAYIKNYKGDNLKADLTQYLQEYFNKSDKEKLTDAVTEYKNSINGMGGYYSSEDLKSIKNAVKTFLQTAVEKGVVIKLGGTNVASTSAITSALANYTDARSLLADMETAINSMSSEPKKTQLINNARAKLLKEEWEGFASIPGSNYQINTGLIDYSKIPGYARNEKVCETKKQGKYGSRDDAAKWLQDNLKEQCWNQIKEMLTAKGIDPNKAKTIFENTFSESAVEAAEECVTGKHHTAFRKSSSYANAKDLTDACLRIFNSKIPTVIDKYNESFDDFETVDIDFTVIDETQDENGNSLGAVTDADGNKVDGLAEAYKNGTVLTIKGRGADYYETVAEKAIDGLRSQMLSKAKTMCEARGVSFDVSKFNAMFNSAKSSAVAQAVTGMDGKSFNFLGSGGGGTGVGFVAFEILKNSSLKLTAAGLGGIAGAAGLGAALLVGLLGNRSSQSNLDVRLLINTFTEEFKNNYTQWVEQEQNKNN